MSARTKPKADAFKIADPDMIAALIQLQDDGIKTPNWSELGETLGGRDRSNTQKTVKRLEAAGLIALNPLQVSETARALHAVWTGNAPTTSAATAAPLPQGSGPVTPGGLYAIPHKLIHPCPLNPRKSFDEAALDELADAIAEQGQLQNIVVRPHPEKPGEYEIAAGERRWRAIGRTIARSPDAPMQTVRALVQDLTDKDLLLVALAENRDRVDPPAMEEARGIAAFREMRIKQILADIYKGDPFEKGFTEAEIAPEIRQATGTAMHECAAAMGKTTRWVELRFNLVEDLAPELQDALDRDAITLAQARAIRKASHHRQRNALELMIDRDHGWHTYDAIIASLRHRGLAAEHAAFDPADYDGEVMEDPETGAPIYMDKALVTTLQSRAMKRIAKELKAEGAAFVEILDYDDGSRFATADENTAAPVGWILILNYDGQIKRRQVVRRADLTASGTQKIKAASSAADTGDGAAPVEEIIPPFGKRHWLQAATINTRRIQQGIAMAKPQLALAIAICGLLPTGYGKTDGIPGDWIKGHWRAAADDDIAPPALLAEFFKDYTEADGFIVKGHHVAVCDTPAALQTITRQDETFTVRMFAAVMASHCGPWPGHSAPPGCSSNVATIASELAEKDCLPSFEMDATYLGNFTLAQRRQIARAAGITDTEIAKMPTAKMDSVAFILMHPERDKAWCPPEIHFTADATVQERVNAMLAGKAVA